MIVGKVGQKRIVRRGEKFQKLHRFLLSCEVGGMRLFDRYTLQALGFGLIVIAVALFYPFVVIPANSLYSGITLIIVGITLLVVERSSKPKEKE
jgi:uncharacterized membrane protein HdeD (DUF308 family)